MTPIRKMLSSIIIIIIIIIIAITVKHRIAQENIRREIRTHDPNAEQS